MPRNFPRILPVGHLLAVFFSLNTIKGRIDIITPCYYLLVIYLNNRVSLKKDHSRIQQVKHTSDSSRMKGSRSDTADSTAEADGVKVLLPWLLASR